LKASNPTAQHNHHGTQHAAELDPASVGHGCRIRGPAPWPVEEDEQAHPLSAQLDMLARRQQDEQLLLPAEELQD